VAFCRSESNLIGERYSIRIQGIYVFAFSCVQFTFFSYIFVYLNKKNMDKPRKESVKSPLKYNKETGVLSRGKTTFDPSTKEQVKKGFSVTMPWKKGTSKDRFYNMKEVSSLAGGEKKVLKSREIKVDNQGKKTKTKVNSNVTMVKTKTPGAKSRISITDSSTGRKYSAKNAIVANRKVNKLKRS
jgi:hypothetical protein